MKVASGRGSTVLLVALACRSAWAARTRSKDLAARALQAEEEVPQLAGYASDTSMICGGPQMWNILTASSSVHGVQNIKWAKMEALQVEHVQAKEKAVKELEVEIQGLTDLIAQKEGDQHVKYTTKEQNQQLVEAALGEESFGGLEVAKDSGCGRVGGGPVRAPRRAYRKSLPIFEEASAKFFAGKQFRLDGDGFLATCNEILPLVSDRSACGHLCQEFKDKAQAASNEAVGETAGDLDELIKQRERKVQELDEARSSIAECDKAWEGISLLREHIEKLKGGMKERFDLLRNAELDLDDARWELSDLDEQLKEEEQLLDLAVEALAEANVDKGKAEGHLQDLRAKEQALRKRLEGLQGPLQRGRSQLSAAKGADKTVVDLKSAVSATMVKMELFSRASVMEPLRNIGFESDIDIEDPSLFPAKPTATHAGGLLQGSVEKMQEYCTGTALPAFAAVKEQVDLAPLCGLGATDSVMQGMSEAVLTRAAAVKKDLLWVQSWLNPYRASKKMTKERAQELVVLGEPKGFQEIISVYHSTKFFRYLKDWRYGGPFLKLLAQLKKITAALEQEVKQLEDEICGLKADLAELEAARDQAIAVLEQMTDALGEASEKKAAVEQAVMGLREKATQMALDIAELEEAVRKAKAAYEAAAAKLVTAHAESTSALPRGKESLAQLEAQSRQADLLVSLIQQSLDNTERSYQQSQAQLSKLRQ